MSCISGYILLLTQFERTLVQTDWWAVCGEPSLFWKLDFLGLPLIFLDGYAKRCLS